MLLLTLHLKPFHQKLITSNHCTNLCEYVHEKILVCVHVGARASVVIQSVEPAKGENKCCVLTVAFTKQKQINT